MVRPPPPRFLPYAGAVAFGGCCMAAVSLVRGWCCCGAAVGCCMAVAVLWWFLALLTFARGGRWVGVAYHCAVAGVWLRCGACCRLLRWWRCSCVAVIARGWSVDSAVRCGCIGCPDGLRVARWWCCGCCSAVVLPSWRGRCGWRWCCGRSCCPAVLLLQSARGFYAVAFLYFRTLAAANYFSFVFI